MRFDDMLATVLAREPDRLPARIALWRQLVDLLAQARDGGDRDLARRAFDRVVSLGNEVPIPVRREVAGAIAGRPLAPAMVELIARDLPQVAGALLSRVRLSDGEWLALMPRLSPTARGFLRHRDDLGPQVEAALAGFGASDLTIAGAACPPEPAAAAAFVPPSFAPPAPTGHVDEPELPLTGGATEVFEPGAGEGQIRAIISRIARYRRGRSEGETAAAADGTTTPADTFFFETGTDGVICWVSGVPRGPLIGESIAVAASGQFGVDGQASGAFRQRAPFRDARLMVAGSGTVAGEWRLAAVPVFAPADGLFLGYRGTARRPFPYERAEPTSVASDAAGRSDAMRQIVHELRTPLNAIGGFAEMIRRQMRGPVAEAYRDRADRIADQAGHLLIAVDDLDVSARLDGAGVDWQRAAVDVASLLDGLCAEQRDAGRARGRAMECGIDRGLPPVIGDAAAIRRMAGRLLTAAVRLAGEDETVRLLLQPASADELTIRITRPRRLADVAEAALFDPGYGPDGDWPDAPLLGLGFSLHLVRRLAVASGGRLLVDADWFTLRLPLVAWTQDASAI